MPSPERRSAVAKLLALPLAASLVMGAATPGPRAPDPRRGEALYVGAVPLLAGGAPCLACHGIAGHGLAHAASFGPDLSGAHAQYGADGLEAALADVPFPSMVPVYRDHVIAPEERADLIAFLAEASGASSPRLGVGYAAGVAAAALGFLGVVVAVGRRGRGRSARRAAEGETR